MAKLVRTEWFGKTIAVLLVNGKTATGELSEVTDTYIVLTRNGVRTQVMGQAIIAISLAEEKPEA